MGNKILEFIKKLLSTIKPVLETKGVLKNELASKSEGEVAAPASTEYVSTYRVGDLAAKYETSNRGPGYISNGSKWGDPGGDSYGSYQLESKLGTLQAYLKGEDKFTQALRGFKINSPEFKAKWVQLAEDDPTGFQQSQFEFLAKKPNGYYDALKYAEKLGWQTSIFALQAAIFSTSNQSGGWVKIFNGAKKSGLIRDQINNLYDSRANYFQNLTSLTPGIKKAIIYQRTVLERQDCLDMLKKVDKIDT